jgi:hypothetical protein
MELDAAWTVYSQNGIFDAIQRFLLQYLRCYHNMESAQREAHIFHMAAATTKDPNSTQTDD